VRQRVQHPLRVGLLGAEHRQQRDDAGDGGGGGGHRGVAQGGQAPGDPVGDVGVHLAELDLLVVDVGVGGPQAGEAGLLGRAAVDHRAGLAGHVRLAGGAPQHADARSGAAVEQLGDQRGVEAEVAVEDDEHPGPAAVDPAVGLGEAAVGDLDQAAEQLAGGVRVDHEVAARQRRGGRAHVGEPLEPAGGEAVGADGGGEHEVLGAVQAGHLGEQRRHHVVDHLGRAVGAHHAEVGEADGDGDVGDRVVAGDDRLDLLAVVVVATGGEGGLHQRGGVAEAHPDREEVLVAAAPGPQVDGAQLGPAGEVGEVGRGAHPLDPLGLAGGGHLGLEGLDPLLEPGHVVAELVAARAPVLDPAAHHHERRDEDDGQEVDLAGQREQQGAGGQRCEHGEQLEPTGLGASRDRAERLELAGADLVGPVRRAVELDLAEAVDGLVSDRMNSRKLTRLDPRATTSSGPTTVGSVMATSLTSTPFWGSSWGAMRTVQSGSTSTRRCRRDTDTSPNVRSAEASRPSR
jgi:hypothetical protein